MNQRRGARWRSGRCLLLGGMALLVAACTTADDDTRDYLQADWLANWAERNKLLDERKIHWLRNFHVTRLPVYTEVVAERFPVTVEPRVAILTLTGGAGGESLAAAELARLDAFIGAYLSRGHGRLTIAVPGTGAESERALARGRGAVARALERGLRETEVVLKVETSGNGAMDRIVASYETFDVRVPVCGDWSKESSHDLTNSIHSNFGCSMQRDFALMVANPADLVAMRAPGLHDTGRSDVVIGLYRAGEPTGAERSEEEKAVLSTVGTAE